MSAAAAKPNTHSLQPKTLNLKAQNPYEPQALTLNHLIVPALPPHVGAPLGCRRPGPKEPDSVPVTYEVHLE